ncbi:MAG: class I SAM-dependent methyltransferase, partial [Pseudomonadota bacterium]
MKMENEMTPHQKPPTLRSNPLKEWVRINFLSPHIQKVPKDKRVLDLACGWGFSFKIHPQWTGIEYDENCVQYLKKKGFDVLRGNLLDPFPFEENSFDMVFSHDVLEHFDRVEVEKIFANVKPFIKPGGLFVNVVPNRLGFDY